MVDDELNSEAPMPSLEQKIRETRKTLSDHIEYLSGNETATRSLIVDVILTALGWNVRDPKRVRLEHRANGNKIDYILLSTAGNCLAVVEAKAANQGIKDSDRRQASGYAAEIGARYAVLTNGIRWESWEMVPQTPRKMSIIVEVNLTTGEISQIAQYLRKLSPSVLESKNLIH